MGNLGMLLVLGCLVGRGESCRIPQIGSKQREPKAVADRWIGASTEHRGETNPGNCTFP